MRESLARRIVNTRSGGRCELCGREGDGLHHRLKRSRGGPWEVWNLLRLCGSGTTGCHGAIEAEPKLATQLGLTLRASLGLPLAAAAPVVCNPPGLWLGWWIPEADGSWTPFRNPELPDLVALGELATRRG